MTPARELVLVRPQSRRFLIRAVRCLLTHLCRQGVDEIRNLGFEMSEECAVKLLDDGLLRCVVTKCPAGHDALAFEGFNPFVGQFEQIEFYYVIGEL